MIKAIPGIDGLYSVQDEEGEYGIVHKHVLPSRKTAWAFKVTEEKYLTLEEMTEIVEFMKTLKEW